MRRSTYRLAEPIRPRQGVPQLAAPRAALENERRFRTAQLDELAARAAEAMRTADAARLQVVLMLRAAADSALAEANAALDRLEQGTYGACESCRRPIPLDRLAVLPSCRRCAPCQYRREVGRPAAGTVRSGYPPSPTSKEPEDG